MSKAVVILGAGASSDFGVPTLQGIFKDKWARRYLKQDQFLAQKLNEIFWAPRGHTLESSDQSVTIEEMLTILRDWENEPSCRKCPELDLFAEFRKRLYVLIMRAVFEGKSTKAAHLNPLIQVCDEKFEQVTWASFNWDCVFDASFWYWQSWAGPGSRSNPSLAITLDNWYGGWPKHLFLKLHGGINWWIINGRLTYVRFAASGDLAKKWNEYSKASNFPDQPVILEPSAYKYCGGFYRLLEPQWSKFFERLCEADYVIMIGYSLPEGDAQARSKMMTAFNINKRCKWLLIDPSEATCARFIRLLGQSSLTVLRKGLAGFDAPSLHTLYIDKPMRGHNLMQAIARVNRVYLDKPGGLVVDYLGIAADLKEALSFYSDAGGKGDPTLVQEKAVELMLEKIEVVSAMYHGFPYENYFEANTSQKLALILSAEEHILGLEDGKKRYVNEVTALSQAFAIAIPHEQAMGAKDEVAFFQAVKSRLAKFDGTGFGRTNEEIETTIRQVVDKALVSEKVIDIFDAAGIKKPDISILSEEFLMELKGFKHKNVALEVLKKLLNDELRARSKKNLVQSKSLMEMLETAIKKYHNKILTAAEVMEELIKISKEIVASDDEAKDLKLSEFEYAFYTAVASNSSAKELMKQDTLRELAVVLTQRVRENASIDWTIKESVRAKLKVIVKRTLREFGYPPDMQLLATETVMKQAEMIAAELTQ